VSASRDTPPGIAPKGVAEGDTGLMTSGTRQATTADRLMATSGQKSVRLLDHPLASYYVTLGSSALLLVLGLAMVLSASTVELLEESGSPFLVFSRQAIWVGIGLPLMWLAARLPVRAYRRLGYPLLLGSLVLLALVLTPGLGISVYGNRNWVDFGGPFRVQPSEFAKLALVLWGADMLTRKRRLLRQWKHLLVPLAPVTAVILVLIMLGNDLGTSVIIAAILLGLLWVAGAPLRVFLGMLLTAGGFVTLFIMLNPNRVVRIAAFLKPDPSTWAGGHALKGFYALAGGGWLGVGIGGSREKWRSLPLPHTDYIFAIIGEELGLVGTLTVLALLAALGYAGLRIALRTRDPFIRLTTAGVTTWVMTQAIINVGGVLGILPIAGIPLPLISYGGSALLPTMVAVGMLLSFAKREPGAHAALVARRSGSKRGLAAREVLRRPSVSEG